MGVNGVAVLITVIVVVSGDGEMTVDGDENDISSWGGESA